MICLILSTGCCFRAPAWLPQVSLATSALNQSLCSGHWTRYETHFSLITSSLLAISGLRRCSKIRNSKCPPQYYFLSLSASLLMLAHKSVAVQLFIPSMSTRSFRSLPTPLLCIVHHLRRPGLSALESGTVLCAQLRAKLPQLL